MSVNLQFITTKEEKVEVELRHHVEVGGFYCLDIKSQLHDSYHSFSFTLYRDTLDEIQDLARKIAELAGLKIAEPVWPNTTDEIIEHIRKTQEQEPNLLTADNIAVTIEKIETPHEYVRDNQDSCHICGKSEDAPEHSLLPQADHAPSAEAGSV